MANIKMSLIALCLFVCIVSVNCSLGIRPQILMEETHNAEQLLRGSHEVKDDDVALMSDFKNIETNPTSVVDDYDSDLDNDTTTITYPTEAPSTTDKPYDITTKSVDTPTTVNLSEVPEALELKTEEYHPRTDKSDVRAETAEATTVVMTTEITDAITESGVAADNVFNTKAPIEDASNVHTENNSDNIKPASTPALQTTTKATNEDTAVMVESRISSDIDPEMESSGVRNPKTDTDTKTPIDKRNEDLKPRPTPASKSSTIRFWLEDSWLRPPPAIVVPLRLSALRRALAVWRELGRVNMTDLVVVGYDANGVNWRSRYALQPSSASKTVEEALAKLLRKYQGVNNYPKGDGTMKALTSAAKLVPYDSALFLITDRAAADPEKLPLAVRALVHKRLKVYTIWTDPDYPSTESETALQDLRNVSSHTEGEVLPFSTKDIKSTVNGNQISLEDDYSKMDSLDNLQPRSARLYPSLDVNTFDMLLVRRGGEDALSVGIPVENGVTALRVQIEGNVDHAVLYPPNDAPQIDLNNDTTIRAFSPASRILRRKPRDVLLVFPGADTLVDSLSVIGTVGRPSPLSGVWHASARCDRCHYTLTLAAHTHIHFTGDVQDTDTIRLRINGPFSSVRETTIVDEFGKELAKLPFSSQPKAGEYPVGNFNRISELEADIPFSLKWHNVYVKAVGRDNGDNAFVRVHGPLYPAEVRQSRSASDYFITVDEIDQIELSDDTSKQSSRLRYNETGILSRDRAAPQVVNQLGQLLTTVQIGLATRLYGAPGANLQLHFEVTNYREQRILFYFQATGQLKFLTGISPSSQYIASGQTVNVVVSALVSTDAEPGARDLITFTASAGSEQVSIQAIITVLNPGEQIVDTWAPSVSHSFQGSCIGRTGDDCSQHSWSTTVTAKDTASGLLRLTSSPVGLVYDSNFIAGSRDTVMAVYRATCCTPRLSVTAVDAMGNAYSYNIDISNYLTGAAISAIVLGVLFAIILIAVIIAVIYVCVKRRKESIDMPSYTSQTRSRTTLN